MFTNSLFKDFMCENKLKTWKDESTRDLICLEFNFGTRSYDEEITHIKKIAKNARIEYKKAISSGSKKLIDIQINKKKKIMSLYNFAVSHKTEYFSLSADDIRKEFYNNGEKVKGNDIIIFTTEKLYKDFKKDLLRYLDTNKDIIKSEINLL